MHGGKYMQNFTEISKIEEELRESIDLTEIAKTYCEFHYDKSVEITTLGTILQTILDKLNTLRDRIDKALI